MSADLHDWVLQQIERHSVRAASPQAVAQGDPTAMTRLADAAAVLRRPRPGGQVFGLAAPPGGIPRSDELAARCLALMAEWAPRIDPRSRDDMGELLRRLELPPLIGAPTREIALVLHVLIDAHAGNIDTDEEVTDPALLATFDGARAGSGTSLVDIPCVRSAVGGDEPWALDGRAELVVDRESGGLRCRLTFELARQPSQDELGRLLTAIERELFFTSWGMNLEWEADDLPEDIAVGTGTEVRSHRFVPARA